MYIPRPAKLLFQYDDGWNRFIENNTVDEWQHITLTMPHLLWPFFNNNWALLNQLFRCATRAMLKHARRHGLEIGIFCALHTYGRQLNQHPHIHLSVTRGGLTQYDTWKPIFFKKKDVEKVWRSAVIRLLRDSYFQHQPNTLPGFGHIRDYPTWCRYLNAQFQRYWKIHFAKKTRGAWHNVKYLGRYLKRPPISASQLKHYSGGAVVHHYYDHHSQQYRQQTLSQEEMIRRYISHIPARHFKMIRYYGFLANRKRGHLLPKVYDALDMNHPNVPEKPGLRPYSGLSDLVSLPQCPVSAVLESAFCQKDPRRLAQREISRPIP